MKRQFINTVLATVIFGLIGLSPAKAQDQAQPGAARISLIQGDVSTQRGDSGDWAAATVNTPVVLGDSVSTGNGSRAEVQLDYANILRLDQGSMVKIADLTRNHIQVQVSQGLVEFSVLKGTEANAEIDTPNMSVQTAGEGEYRIEIASPTETRVTVRKGEAQISTPQGSTRVNTNEMIIVQGTTEDAQFRVDPAPGRDDWDQWNRDRDRVILSAGSWSHTNRYYTGSEDLDRYGHWVDDPDYGQVWQPYVSDPDWAPYRDGRWVWEPYYGWTWASYEPWGWAPYHYGRWFLAGNNWCWWPGRVYADYYPLWSPAYVSFFGFGGGNWGFNFGFGFGGGWGAIGWLPIGPCDYFHPWWEGWGGRGREVNVVNVTNITNITNINNIHTRNDIYTVQPLYQGNRVPANGSNLQAALTNNRVRQGITVVPPSTFVAGRVPPHPQPVSLQNLKQGQMAAGQIPVVPTRDSLRPTNVAAKPSTMPNRGAAQTHFFTKNQPPSGPAPFAQRQSQIQQVVRQSPTVVDGAKGIAGNASQAPGQLSGQRAGQQPPITKGRPAASSGQLSSQAPVVTGRGNVAGPPATRVGPPSTSASQSGSGWRRFSGPPNAAPDSHTGAPVQAQRSSNFGRPSSGAPTAPALRPQAQRPGATMPNSGSTLAAGWRRFGSSGPRITNGANSPTSGNTLPPPSMRSAPPITSRPPTAPPRVGGSANSSSWTQFGRPTPNVSSQPQPRAMASLQGSVTPPRPQTSQSGGWRGFSQATRPPLQISRPVTTQRAPGNSGGSSAPTGNGGYSVPRSNGGYSAPRGYSAPAPRVYSAPSGGAYSAPRGGSGYSAARGGGGYSAPRGGGYSAPRGGSGYSAPRASGGYSGPRGGGGSSAPRGGGGGSGHGGSSSHPSAATFKRRGWSSQVSLHQSNLDQSASARESARARETTAS